ncbi:MAG: chromosome segregation protein SMC [Planctomycetota bacterium]|jgi:chromosome segregation protein
MLKSLELFGFKSFADRTRFDFSHGITCVVGPNGSGKSNVVDAMKWILGDQSPKSLRGKEMTDVIFNGSSGRKASAFAEAVLTFDNSQQILPIETDEVTIGRRLWRNGDSEYLINGATARLKDIRDAFMGTGAGTSAYSIIEQGRVGQILQSNPAARRIIFEEAAGISRFKSKKTEALRKLERVSQNLVRLQDIVDQLESQLNSTRSQAAKAAKYREVTDELKTAWFGLAADDHAWLSDRQATVAAELAETEAALERLIEQQHAIDQRLASFDGELGRVDDQLRDAERASAATREAAVSLEATIRHETARMRETESEVVRLRRQHAGTLGRLAQVEQERTAAQRELDQFVSSFEAQQQAVEQHERRIDELKQAFDANRAQIESSQAERSRLNEEASRIRQQVALLEAQLRSLEETREQNQDEQARLESELADATQELERQQQGIEEVLARAAAVSGQWSDQRKSKQQLVATQDETRKRLVELRERRSATQARLAVLEDLEQRQEGIGLGVREILKRARTSDYPPWSHIVGSVADMLDVELENAALMEVALGSRAQLIVLDDLEPLVAYLNRGEARIDGRVGFLGLNGESLADVEAGQNEQSVELERHPSVVCRADGLLAESCPQRELAARLLSSTWIVIDLDAARELAAGEGRGQRFVTLQGELIEPEGIVYAGSVRGESAVLSRKNELRRLKNDVTRLDQSVASSESHLQTIAEQLNAVQEQLAATAAQRDEVNDELARRRTTADSQQRLVQQLTEQKAGLAAGIAEAQTQTTETQAELAARFDALSAVEEQMQTAETEMGRWESELIEFEQERNQLVQQQTEQRLQLARQTERHDSLTESLSRLSDEATSQRDQAAEIIRRSASLAERLQTSELVILNSTAELAELAIRSESGIDRVRVLFAEKDKLRMLRSEMGDEESSLRQKRRSLSETQHGQEVELRDIRHRLSTCGERIEEEYGVSIDDVAASGASAFREFLIERGHLEADEAAGESELSDESAEGLMLDGPDDVDEPSRTVADHDDVEVEDDVEDQSLSDDELLLSEEALPVPGGGLPFALQVVDDVRYEDVREELSERVDRLRRRLKSMGSVNTESLETLDDLEERFNHFNSQLMDLTEAKSTLEDIIRRINSESRRMFMESFEAISTEFRELFRKLFGGGDGDIILEDPDDVLDCGIDIVARPPGKELRSITLLSGGEKTMTAVALLLAIFKSNPSPFCILDEVDAALDDANVERYASVIHEFKEMTQFIMISHRKRTMTVADRIFGVTMEQSGVSKRLTVSFEQVGENGEIISTGGAQAA